MKKSLFGLFLLVTIQLVSSQEVERTESNQKIKFSGGVQFWMRYTELNPGSTIQNTEVKETVDVSIRRIRLSMKGQLSDKWSYKLGLGVNNLTYLKEEAGLDILDVEATYAYRTWLQIGGGKTGYNGFSRFSTPSTMSMVGHDWPIFAAPTINISDDLLRRMGVFVKGQIGKLDYRSALSRPSLFQSDSPPSPTASYNNGLPGILRSFYAKYQFLDKESNASAFSPGTYLGEKKVLSLGMGAQLQRDAFITENILGDTTYHDMVTWSVDIFFDAPMNPENTISMNFYFGYFNYDFGPNYLRNIGANNPATGGSESFNGRGNSYPAVGTGDVVFIQGAVRIATPKFITGLQSIQPYTSIQYASYDRLNDKMLLFDSGLSFLFKGHSSKFNIGYQNRPIFREVDEVISESTRNEMVILQYQLKF